MMGGDGDKWSNRHDWKAKRQASLTCPAELIMI